MFEFHPAVLAVPFVAWAVREAYRDDARRAVLAGVLVLLCRSELAWVLVGIAVIAGPRARRGLLSISLVGLVAGFAIPAALGARGTFEVHYGHIGATPTEALTHPWRVLEALLSSSTGTKLVILLLPVFGLALFSLRWAAAVVVSCLPVLLSQWPGTEMPWFHYFAPMYPIAVAGALAVLAAPPGRTILPRLLTYRLVIVGCVVALALNSPIAPRAPGGVALRSLTDHRGDRQAAAAAAAVQPGDAVVASNAILAHLTHRREAWLFPSPYRPFDPPELGARVSKEAQARVDVVVVEGRDIRYVESQLQMVGTRIQGILVVRRSTG
jgi:uncharacterized membrane protein